MKRHTVALVVGSLRRESFNRRLADALVKLAPPELEFQRLEIGDLPLYNQDDDANPHANVRRLKDEVRRADALLFVTPEYNRSMPGVLKNALDHASRPYGQNAWAGKPAGVLGISVGATGTSMAQQHLRTTLAYLDVPTLGQPEMYLQVRDDMYDAQGNATGASREMLQKWMDRYVEWVQTILVESPAVAARRGQPERPAAGRH